MLIPTLGLSSPGAHPGEGFGGRNPSLLEVNAMLLMTNIVKQLSNDSVYSGSNQTLKKIISKISHFCLLTLSELPSWKISGCAPEAVYPLWWPSLTKDMQTEQLLYWSGVTDTEHSATSRSNEEDEG